LRNYLVEALQEGVLATAPIFDEDGIYDRAVAGIVDITQRVQAESALQEALKELKETQAILVQQ
jgi:hypothetical protein